MRPDEQLRFPHQVAGAQAIIDKPGLILGYRPGRGKSRTVVDGACALYRDDQIDTVVVVAPANLRSIWLDPDPVLGEWSKWAWPGTPYTLIEYHAKTRIDRVVPEGLAVVVTNPEFLRRPERLNPLLAWVKTRRVLLVLDESWNFQSPRAQQTRAVWRLRQACARVVLLNGTLGEIKHQFAQFSIVSPDVFNGMNWWQFRSRFCVMGGWQSKQITGYQREEEYAARTAPYVLLEDGGDDFARVAPPVRTTIEARLSPATWRIYTQLRDEFVAWLEGGTATALQAGVRALRLAQVANGFVGGVELEGGDLLDPCPQCMDTGERAGSVCDCASDKRAIISDTTTRELGREKLDALIQYITDTQIPSKLLIFTRFRPDVARTVRVLAETFPNHRVVPLYGGQSRDERDEAKRLLAPGGDPRPAIIVANAQSGGAGLNLTAASTCIFLGHDYALKTRRQAEGRIDRTGQTNRVTFTDIIAVGPNGEATIDRGIVTSLRRQKDLSLTTVEAWSKILQS